MSDVSSSATRRSAAAPSPPQLQPTWLLLTCSRGHPLMLVPVWRRLLPHLRTTKIFRFLLMPSFRFAAHVLMTLTSSPFLFSRPAARPLPSVHLPSFRQL